MASEHDPETLALCRQLCTRAGMLFEDASPKAVLIGSIQPEELSRRIQDVKHMAEEAIALLNAAELMIGE